MRILFFLLFSCTTLIAQTPYQLKTGRELGILGTAGGLNGASAYFNLKTFVLQEDEINQLDPLKIPGIDRWSVNNFSRSAQKTSDKFLFGSFALPFLLFLDDTPRRSGGEVSLIYLETMLLNWGVTNVTKTMVKRPRPYMYNENVPMSYKMKKSAQYSFFSGHTSFTAANSFLAAKMYDDFYPDSKAAPIVWGLAAAIPAFTGYKRIKGGKHFLTDVLVGYAVGAGIGILVPTLHK